MKRILAAAAMCCMLPGIIAAPVAGAPVSAAGISAASAEAFTPAGTEYTDSASFAAKVQNIIAGSCGVYADAALTTPVSLPVGSALNTWQTYFVDAGGHGWSGMQCYIYAQGVYSVLFGVMPGNGGSNSERLRNVLSGVWELTPEVLRANKVMPGAYIRTTANYDLSFNGNAGHSMILLGYTDTTITILEGNANGQGAIELNTFTYDRFNSRFTTGKNRGICQVIQPDASVYKSMYGMVYSGMMPEENSAYTVPAVTTTAAVTTTTKATTTTTRATTATTKATTTATTKATTATTKATTATTKATAATTTATAATTTATTTATTATTSAARATTAAAASAAVTVVTATETVTEPVSVQKDVIYEPAADTPIFLPLANAEQYQWSTSDPEVAVLIWDGIAVTRKQGTAVISAVKGNVRYDFEICVEGVNWDRLGDVNGDGSTDPIDAVMVMNSYMKTAMVQRAADDSAILPAEIADVDGNGVVDIADAQLILQYYVSSKLKNSTLSAREAWEATLQLQNK